MSNNLNVNLDAPDGGNPQPRPEEWVEHLDFSILTVAPAAPVGAQRKNLGFFHRLLSVAMSKGFIKPGDKIYTRRITEMLAEQGLLDRLFTRLANGPKVADPARAIDGAARAVGDILGGHGLRSRRVGVGRYLAPQSLPTVEGDRVLSSPVYGDEPTAEEATAEAVPVEAADDIADGLRPDEPEAPQQV